MSARTLLTLVLPGAIAVTGAVVLLLAGPVVTRHAADTYPIAAAGIALFLAARFDRSRLFVLALALLTAMVLLRGMSGDDPRALRMWLSTLLPLVFGTLIILRDAPVLTRTAVLQLASVFGVGAVAGGAFALWRGEITTLLSYELVDPLYSSWSRLEQPALLLWTLSLGILLIVTIRRRHAPEAGVLWSGVCTVLALCWPAPAGRDVWLLAAAVALAVALVESSRALALHDELTGLPARRALNQTLASLRAPYALAIVDVDHFKNFNDRHGHDVGDQVLRMVAARLERVQAGTAYRSGGEEFTVVFAGLSRAEAVQHMEVVRGAIESASFTVRRAPRPRHANAAVQRGRSGGREQKLRVTVSVGVASSTARSRGIEGVLKAADKAMYRAKKEGRNRVVA